MRPEYVTNGDIPSIQTWEEACAISQDWAFDARLAAAKRRRLRAIILLLLTLAMLAVAVALLVIVVG